MSEKKDKFIKDLRVILENEKEKALFLSTEDGEQQYSEIIDNIDIEMLGFLFYLLLLSDDDMKLENEYGCTRIAGWEVISLKDTTDSEEE